MEKIVNTRRAIMAKFNGKEVSLNKPFRLKDHKTKKFGVYVEDKDGEIKLIRFGAKGHNIKRDDPEARANFRARHNCDGKSDKTTAGYWSCLMWGDKPVGDIVKRIEIKKANEEKRIVYAWAYVCSVSGDQVVDHSGDVIDEEEMERMAYDFMEEYRDGGEMHNRRGVASAVASMPFTKELQESLGIDVGKVGWLIVFRINDDDVWEKVKNGTYKMMSIGGKATREKIVN